MMRPIAEIAAATGVSIDAAIVDADQYHTVTGMEFAIGHGICRHDASMT